MTRKFIIVPLILLNSFNAYGFSSQESLMHSEQSKKCINTTVFLKHPSSCLHRERFIPETPSADELIHILIKSADTYYELGDYANTEKTYRQALQVKSDSPDAWLKLAVFYSNLNRERDALQILHNGLIKNPDNADIYHEMGLIQVRLKQLAEAIVSLAKAALLAPENPHYSYVYGIAMNSYQRSEEAIDILKKAHLLHPDNQEIITALITINQDNSNSDEAYYYAEKLLELDPENTSLQQFVLKLKSNMSSDQ